MKFAIFGTKKEALYLAEKIKNNSLGKVEIFVDNDINKQNILINEIPVVSFDILKKMYGTIVDTVIIAARGSNSRLAISNQLKEKNILNVGLFKFSYCDYKKEIKSLDESIIWLNKINKPILPYVEYNVVDSCNLKCKGCTHFSNLFDDESFSNYDSFCKDLEQISQKVYIAQLRLLGGEPLLHPQLHLFIDKAREILPNADICIVTNGLLINKISEDIFYSMKKNNVGFHISRYIPTDNQLEKILTILKKENIDFLIEEKVITQFGKSLDMRGISNSQKSQAVCMSLGCRFLRNGKMYKCPFEGLIDKFADYYNYDLPQVRGVDIYDETIVWKEKLDEYLCQPVEMCHYCAERCEMFEWKVENNPQKEDWIVKSDKI